MGDSENALPPSKKRVAGRELSRDNPGLDDEDEEVFDQEAGFKKASEEVLANRRIVKVRRKTAQAPSAPSSNPFAAIRLVPPTEPIAAPPTFTSASVGEKMTVEVAEPQDNANKDTEKEEEGEEAESKVSEPESRPKADEEKHEAVKQDEAVKEGDKEQAENKDDVKEETAAKEEAECETKNETETDEKNTEAASVNSFQQLSSSQNAFTGIVGTGFSSSSFSFGSITKDQPSFPSFSFGTNGNSSLFSTSGSSEKPEAPKKPSMQEVQVETGEENENAVFTADSVLFEFLDGGWKERGKGELKVNVSTNGTGKGRLVMRARGNFRLILNASLFPDMKLTNMEKKGVTFACLNSAGEGKDSLSTFALKFKDASFVEEFRAVVSQHKGDNAAAVSSLKTPENSPKADE